MHGLSHRLGWPPPTKVPGSPGHLAGVERPVPGHGIPAQVGKEDQVAQKEAKELTVREKEMFACFEEVVIGLQETEKDILLDQGPLGFLSTQDTAAWPAVVRSAGCSPREEARELEPAGRAALLGEAGSYEH